MSPHRTQAARLNAARIFPAHWVVRLEIDSLPVQADGSALSWPLAPAREPATSRASLHLMHHDAFTRALRRSSFPVSFGNFAVNATFTAVAGASGKYCKTRS